MSQNTTLILHRKSANRPEAKEAVKAVIKSGISLKVQIPWNKKNKAIIVRETLAAGTQCIIAGDGDGTIKTAYEIRGGKPTLIKLPKLNFIDDKEGKPVGIHQHIGRRPIFAAGNSDGDFQMLEYTTSSKGSRFGLLVHHDDANREWAYDTVTHTSDNSNADSTKPKSTSGTSSA